MDPTVFDSYSKKHFLTLKYVNDDWHDEGESFVGSTSAKPTMK